MVNRIEIIDGAVLRIAGNEDAPTLMMLAGFPDNGYLFEPLFSTELAKNYRIVAIDLWGFGASPRKDNLTTIAEYGQALSSLINNFIPDQPVGLIGHSIASAIWVKTAIELKEKVTGLFSIEGNLTPEDAFFSGRAANYDDPDKFKREFLEHVWNLGENSTTLRRYYAGACTADAVAMWNLGRDAARISINNEPGQSYKDLSQPTIYYWAEESTPDATKKWIENSGIRNQIYANASHWPTLDQPDEVAKDLADFFDQI